MKNALLLIGLAVFALIGAVQTQNAGQTQTGRTTTAKKSPTPAKKNTTASAKTTAKPTPKAAPKKDDKAELDKAFVIEDAEKKSVALAKFLSDFPKSEHRPRAMESLTAARVTAGDTKLAAGDREGGLKLTRLAIAEAPVPYPAKLFDEVISKVPQSLYFRGEAVAAHEIAFAIEKNLSTAPQFLALASFYVNSENSSEARRLAEAALKLDEKSRDAYMTLGMANRLSFEIEAAAAAFEKAVEIDQESIAAKQSLAEMKRALGRTDEALAIFNTLLEKDAGDIRSLNGKILTLFDAGKRVEAEAELTKAIEASSGNVVLIGGAAYWYAAKGESAKAIDLAGKAIAAEPRYIWSHIALAKAYASENRLVEAEQTLLKARKYGNFATLEYEIALVRLAAGFYREAADELQKSFSIREGNLVTKLGRRIERTDKTFSELLASERKASILEPLTSDNSDGDAKLKALIELRAVLSSPAPDAIKAAELADVFTAGSDRMRFHRQLFASNELLEKKVAPAKAMELSRAAVSAVDEGLSIGNPAGPIMAAEIYDARTAAIAADKYILVPEVPKATLSAIARGRIEEIAGWSLLQQGSNPEAATRFRRAVNILPEKSAWWRSSYWMLGNALEADGKDKEALDAYVKSYSSTDPNAAKYASIETVYKRVNSSIDGLDKLIGENPAKPKAAEVTASASPEVKPEATPEAKSDTSTEKKTDTPAETKEPAAGSTPVPEPSIETKPSPIDLPLSKPADEIKKTADVPVPKVKPSPSPDAAKPSEEKPVEIKPESKPADETITKSVENTTEIKPSPTPQPESQKATDDAKTSKPEDTTEIKPEPKPTPKPLFEPVIIEVKGDKPASSSEVSKDPAKGDPAARPRLVEGKEVSSDAESACSLSVSQENISIIGGSSVGILVGVDGGEIKDVKFATSSPKDIEVRADIEIVGIKGRALFVIKSITESTGIYQVTFSSPCGKKDVIVKVR